MRGASLLWACVGLVAAALLLAPGAEGLYIRTGEADIYLGPGGTVASEFRTPGAAHQYGRYESTAQFLFTSTSDHLDYYSTIQEVFGKPMITVVQGEGVVDPEVFGAAADGYYFDGQSYWPEVPDLNVVFNCQSDGLAAIKIEVRTSLLHTDHGSTKSVNETVSFFARKQCFSSGFRDGFSIGFEEATTDVVRQGVVQNRWALESSYFLDDSPAVVGAEQQVAMFQLAIMNEYYGNQYFAAPRVRLDDDDLLAVHVRGNAEHGGVATTRPETLVLLFECFGTGDATVVVEVSLGFFGTVEFGFVKECRAADAEEAEAAGAGVLHVGTSRAAYAGVVQASSTSFEWSVDGPSAVVGVDEHSTVFYLSTESGKNQTFLAPVVGVHPSTAFRTSLSGPLRSGGVANGLPQRLVVNYICSHVAEAQVTVTIPLPHHAAVEFAFTKQCKPLRQGERVYTANQVLFLIMIMAPLLGWAVYSNRAKLVDLLP